MGVKINFLISILFVVLICSCANKKSHQAEKVFINGHIITMDESNPEAEAIAVGNGEILAVGKTRRRLVPSAVFDQAGSAESIYN